MLGSIEQFVPGDDIGEYIERLEQFFVLNDVQKTKKVASLLTFIGHDAYSVLKKLTYPKSPKELIYKELISKLKVHYSPEINEISERYKFHKEDQKEGQCIVEYIVELKSKAQNCNFGAFLEEALRDRFVFGVRESKLRALLLKESKLTFASACQIATYWEMAEKEIEEKPLNQFAVRKLNNYGNTKMIKCHKCSKYGHFARFCYTKLKTTKKKIYPNSNWRRHEGQDRSSDVIKELSEQMVGQVVLTSDTSINKLADGPLKIMVMVNGIKLDMEIDTGACASVISENTYQQLFSKSNLCITNSKFMSVTGELIGIIVTISVNVCLCDTVDDVYKLNLLVIKSTKSISPLLGRSWLNKLCPDWRNKLKGNGVIKLVSNTELNTNYNDSILKYIKSKFPRVLSEEGGQCIEKYKAEIVLKPGVTPIFHKAYSVPFSIRDKVGEEIDRLVEQGILEPVKYSDWASPIVVVPKSDGSLRICIDCKVTINKSIKTEHYPLPKADDVFASLSGCKIFCVVDLSGAYQQLDVSMNSREYLTINTLKGLFRYKRLPFGVSSAPAIFQSVMDQVLFKVENVFCYLDDILIGAIDKDMCKKKLDEVLTRLNEFNIRINLKKCKFFESSVNYLGHTIDEMGIRPMKQKLEAIKEAREPTNLNELKAYLGLLNYYCKFVPNLSSELHELHKLLKKGVKFEWTEKCSETFNRSKELLLNNQLLGIYDSKKPIIVYADASPYGVGAILVQLFDREEKPICFSSSTLSPAEQNYAQIHREALAIVFAVKKFHKYIYGNKFTLCSDSQALKEIFSPNKGNSVVAASRLQRWSVFLSMYDYDFKYKPAKQMVHVDALSRLPLKTGTEIEEISINRLSIMNDFNLNIEEIRKGYKEDKTLLKVIKYVKNGWEGKLEECKYYFKMKNDLGLQDDCLFFGDRVVIPEHLKERVLQLLHKDHNGIVRMKMEARGILWWRNMAKDIEETVKRCEICAQTQNVPKEVVTSRWPKTNVKLMNRVTVEKVIEVLQSIFTYFGLPGEIVSDNGPPFNSHVFNNYGKECNIKIIKSPPYHSQSNGQAERGVQTVKKYLNKYLLDYKIRTAHVNQLRVKTYKDVKDIKVPRSVNVDKVIVKKSNRMVKKPNRYGFDEFV
ncbi:uncharacterized protein K02A2.6-like [Daktulosphaira vitifoliae]|uniref:uncharacterized protein K02A2.6-like n=1 Tax=Daktulosphaira vitifoliae TaxID=58002 RepID=UPI0021A98FAA|nr:uncharacterized protein K02A2.6-like [Daktulosphaira vitifoliae]